MVPEIVQTLPPMDSDSRPLQIIRLCVPVYVIEVKHRCLMRGKPISWSGIDKYSEWEYGQTLDCVQCFAYGHLSPGRLDSC